MLHLGSHRSKTTTWNWSGSCPENRAVGPREGPGRIRSGRWSNVLLRPGVVKKRDRATREPHLFPILGIGTLVPRCPPAEKASVTRNVAVPVKPQYGLHRHLSWQRSQFRTGQRLVRFHPI